MPNGTQLRHKAAGFPPGLSWHELVQRPKSVPPLPTPEWVPSVPPHAARPGPADVKKSVKYSTAANVLPRRELRVLRRSNGVLGTFHRALVSRSPRAAAVPGAAVRMAAIRDETVAANNNRIARRAAKATR
jgi:hypothetical protein